MKIHFIAIGGSAMHNLAIALHKKGYKITGSDDEIFEPSRGRLLKYGLLPAQMGWDASRIHKNLDAIILGMHAREDNPELLMARKLGLKIFSYPEFLYEQSKNKTRIVIGGSHGKTTITSMILHVLQQHGIKTDYMVGAQLEGFEVMVQLSDDAPYIVLEGDEYLSSPLDRRPKFHLYQPHIALLSGIAWDHINVFPSFENYIEQFSIFIDKIEPNGKLIYCEEDETLKKLCEGKNKPSLCLLPYHLPEYSITDGVTQIHWQGQSYPLQVFGKHNLLNIAGALTVCRQMGLSTALILEAMSSFKGASNRLQLLAKSPKSIVFKDFAHAPSKLRATLEAVREQFAGRKLVACMELHTFSSLNKDFLDQYKHTMDMCDEAFVFYNPHALQLKRLPDLNPDQIRMAFGRNNIHVISQADQLKKELLQRKQDNSAFLLMSSGNFGNLDMKSLAEQLVNGF